MSVLLKLVVFTIVLFSTGLSAPVNEDGSIDEDDIDITMHLSNFGYLPKIDPQRPQLISNNQLSNAIRDYQEYMGLEVTGKLDSQTKKQMARPRCGIQDRVPPGPNGLSNFKLGGSRWKKRTLSYKITKYPSNFPRGDTDKTMQAAFDIWSRVTPLRFVKKGQNARVHIEIRFEKGSHGDDAAFDGPGQTLAHAYYPIASRWGGDAHFDDTERWTINSAQGTNLLQTAAHEIGHSLGLDHSNIVGALMFPTLNSYQPNFELHEDDIKAIQRLYPR
ncbi:interstitial collagenase-like [Macrosteles quadrilineatus]|uniref:interstitial collagenase-like n=1 Tax=Macrosteles quadrilineatus TaxID=74068 RepID=UPI0023E315DA|nr:interstitial collagenase-like [Macrosteles quadrilineatus]